MFIFRGQSESWLEIITISNPMGTKLQQLFLRLTPEYEHSCLFCLFILSLTVIEFIIYYYYLLLLEPPTEFTPPFGGRKMTKPHIIALWQAA